MKNKRAPEPPKPQLTDVQKVIVDVCQDVAEMLIDKNRKYGNSAITPIRVFSKADSMEQLRVRMDDKINRIRNTQADDNEDAYMDLLGYLVLYQVAKRLQ